MVSTFLCDFDPHPVSVLDFLTVVADAISRGGILINAVAERGSTNESDIYRIMKSIRHL